MRTCNINQYYVDEDEPWSGILAASVFLILSTKNRMKGYIPGQLICFHDMILPIKHTVDWELIRQKNQTQINKYNIRNNRNQVDHDYIVRDKGMPSNHTSYKYKTPHKGPFVITRRSANITVSL